MTGPGGEPDFERLVAPYRREPAAHCYRMLGARQDAEDALQEALLAAWQGLRGLEGRSSLRTWLYMIATNVCLRMIERRPKRLLTPGDAALRPRGVTYWACASGLG